jgi:transcriptional regulator with XRE-family HTH domain
MKHHVDMHVGQRIRRRRWMLGMTQQQLGEAVGIKFQQIQKYETGMNRVSASRLYDIATSLEVPVSFFFDGVTEENADIAMTEEDVTAANTNAQAKSGDIFSEKETLELIRCYYQMPEEPRRRLFELTKSLSRAA